MKSEIIWEKENGGDRGACDVRMFSDCAHLESLCWSRGCLHVELDGAVRCSLGGATEDAKSGVRRFVKDEDSCTVLIRVLGVDRM